MSVERAEAKIVAGLPALVFWEEWAWVAQCTEYDIAAQGDTIDEALEHLRRCIETYRHLDREAVDGFHMSDLLPPPDEYIWAYEVVGGVK